MEGPRGEENSCITSDLFISLPRGIIRGPKYEVLDVLYNPPLSSDEDGDQGLSRCFKSMPALRTRSVSALSRPVNRVLIVEGC